MSFRQRDRTRYLGLETVQDPHPPPLAELEPHYMKLVSVVGKDEETYAITSSEGPSRAGPISERVVKPEALGILSVHALQKRE
jgi:hypothetical protein